MTGPSALLDIGTGTRDVLVSGSGSLVHLRTRQPTKMVRVDRGRLLWCQRRRIRSWKVVTAGAPHAPHPALSLTFYTFVLLSWKCNMQLLPCQTCQPGQMTSLLQASHEDVERTFCMGLLWGLTKITDLKYLAPGAQQLTAHLLNQVKRFWSLCPMIERKPPPSAAPGVTPCSKNKIIK